MGPPCTIGCSARPRHLLQCVLAFAFGARMHTIMMQKADERAMMFSSIQISQRVWTAYPVQYSLPHRS